jgi:hypothetical protein
LDQVAQRGRTCAERITHGQPTAVGRLRGCSPIGEWWSFREDRRAAELKAGPAGRGARVHERVRRSLAAYRAVRTEDFLPAPLKARARDASESRELPSELGLERSPDRTAGREARASQPAEGIRSESVN